MSYTASRYTPSEGRPPLFPPAVAAFLRRRMLEATGGALLAAAALITVALLTYDPADPSFNTATANVHTLNWLGRPGSYGADILVQSLGVAAFVPVLMLAGWGLRIALKMPLRFMGWRVGFTLMATLFAAGAFAGLPAFGAWPYGCRVVVPLVCFCLI